jgi:hypothetical protein
MTLGLATSAHWLALMTDIRRPCGGESEFLRRTFCELNFTDTDTAEPAGRA